MSKGRVVYKYDLDCNFICSYLSTSQAARDMNCDEAVIRRKANNNDKYSGFFWSRTKPYNNKLVIINERYVYESPIPECGGDPKDWKWVHPPLDIYKQNSNFQIKSFKLTSQEEHKLAESSKFNKTKNILVIGDLHAPFIRSGYLEFCKETYIKYKCTDVVFIGDLLDNHFSSFWKTDADGHGAKEELRRGKLQINEFYKTFPKAKVCLGNHDLIPQRQMFNAGVSKTWLKEISEILETPGWDYAEEFIIDNVMYVHGTGRKADMRMQQDLISIVQGHYHSESYIKYSVGKKSKLFALQIGCGIKDDEYAFAYRKYFAKNHINCGVVLDNGELPILVYMNLNK